MFHKWRDAALRDGARSSGAVVDASETRPVAPVVNSEVYEYQRTIRVTFPDDSVGETDERIPLHRVQQLADRRTIDCWPRLAERTKIGAIVPVRYDESDHSHIVLDLPALIAEILTGVDQSASA